MEVIKTLINCIMWASNAGAVVTIGLILNFDYVSSLKEKHVMAFLFSSMCLPFTGNMWEYYQVSNSRRFISKEVITKFAEIFDVLSNS